MKYGQMISFGFSNAWKYKALWIFGFFIGGAGGFNTGSRWDMGKGDFGRISDIESWIAANPLIIIAIAALVLALVIIFIIMSTISTGGLINAADQIKRENSCRFGAAFKVGLSKFWPILGLGVLSFVCVLAFVLILAGIGVVAFLIHLALGILSLVILIPLFIVGLFIAIVTIAMAQRIVVLENSGVIDSIGEGYSLWTKQLGSSIVFTLIYLGISIAIMLATVLIFIFVAMPFVAIAFVHLILALAIGIPVALLIILLITGFTGSATHLMTTEFYFQLRDIARPPATGSIGPDQGYSPPETPPAAPPAPQSV